MLNFQISRESSGFILSQCDTGVQSDFLEDMSQVCKKVQKLKIKTSNRKYFYSNI